MFSILKAFFQKLSLLLIVHVCTIPFMPSQRALCLCYFRTEQLLCLSAHNTSYQRASLSLWWVSPSNARQRKEYCGRCESGFMDMAHQISTLNIVTKKHYRISSSCPITIYPILCVTGMMLGSTETQCEHNKLFFYSIVGNLGVSDIKIGSVKQQEMQPPYSWPMCDSSIFVLAPDGSEISCISLFTFKFLRLYIENNDKMFFL